MKKHTLSNQIANLVSSQHNLYLPIEFIGRKWVIGKDWHNQGLSFINDKFSSEAHDFDLNHIRFFISNELIFFFGLYSLTWENIISKGVSVFPDLLKKQAAFLAKQLHQEMPYTETYVENVFFTYETDLYLDNYLCICGKREPKYYDRQCFEIHHSKIVIDFNTQFLLSDLNTSKPIPFQEFQHWLPYALMVKLETIFETYLFLQYDRNMTQKEAFQHLSKQIKCVGKTIKKYSPKTRVFMFPENYGLTTIQLDQDRLIEIGSQPR